jgi:hypothetical protein
MKQRTKKILLRVPHDVLEKLPPPSGNHSGKFGTGRAGVIIDLLRRGLAEQRQNAKAEAAQRPAEGNA